jgi:hypothetical protein
MCRIPYKQEPYKLLSQLHVCARLTQRLLAADLHPLLGFWLAVAHGANALVSVLVSRQQAALFLALTWWVVVVFVAAEFCCQSCKVVTLLEGRLFGGDEIILV